MFSQSLLFSIATSLTTKKHGINMLDFSTFRNVINGQLVDTKLHRQGTLPVSSASHHDVPVATKDDLDQAVDAAREAFVSWSQTPITERKRLLLLYADAVEKETTAFVTMLTKEQGKPVCTALLSAL